MNTFKIFDGTAPLFTIGLLYDTALSCSRLSFSRAVSRSVALFLPWLSEFSGVILSCFTLSPKHSLITLDRKTT